jgi:DNA-directed RNA polymerase specialized sigma subunit
VKTERPDFGSFRNKALQNDEVRAEYESLAPLFGIKKQLVAARLARGITQEQIAQKLGISKSNISRLESLNNTRIPNLGTLMRYAGALGMRLDIGLRE